MMKTTTLILFIASFWLQLLLFDGVNSVVSLLKATDKPGHPGECYDEELDSYFAIGSRLHNPNQCQDMHCLQGDEPNTTTTRMYSCNTPVGVWPTNCKLSIQSQYAIYPECCPKLQCDGPNEGPITVVG